MPIYTWYSPSLNAYAELNVPMHLRDVPPEEYPEDWTRILEMPSTLRKTYLDGQRRDLDDFKKISKLNVEAAELPKNDPRRNEIQSEITARKKL